MNRQLIHFEHIDYEKLVNFLLDHEEDIAMEINDFKELNGIFITIFDRPPYDGMEEKE